MSRRAVRQLEAVSAAYAERDVDVSCFPVLWHAYKVGQLLATDLDRVSRRHGLSMADVHLLGAVRGERSTQLRATDLAQRLYVSNAALSARLAKLERKGLLVRIPSATDRRAFEVRLTAEGVAAIDAAIEEVGKSSAFVRCYAALAVEDQNELVRILGELHEQLDRHVAPAGR